MRKLVAGLVGLAAAVGSIGLALPATASVGARPVVRTDAGLVRGVTTSKAEVFNGIPYAAPPVGSLRWRSPKAVTPWAGVRDASQPGDRCAQPADPVVGSPASDSEDCLYLNVTVPRRNSSHRALPVMVWIHGGGMRTGAGSDADEQRLASQGGVVAVTINYRLGPLGFFAHPGLEGGGTFGLQDQQAALRWVRRNAHVFGGDPRNVTIFGLSAGGDSVCAQLASPTAAGLFSKAIYQSGSCTRVDPIGSYLPGAGPAAETFKERAVAEQLGVGLREKLGCASVECLRGIAVPDLLAYAGPEGLGVYWSPTVGTPTLPLLPSAAFRSGRFNKVPVITGTARDEGTLFAMGFPSFSKADYEGYLDFLIGESSPLVKQRYAFESYTPIQLAVADLISDRTYGCPMQQTRGLLSRHVPTYGYEFADRSAPMVFDLTPPYPFGAYHGSDIAYVHGGATKVTFTREQERLSRTMIAYWSNFAKRGNPNSHDVPRWDRFRPSNPIVQSLAPGRDGVRPTDFATTHSCAMWAGIDTY